MDYSNLLEQHDYALIDRAAITPEPWHAELGLPIEVLLPKTFRNDAENMPGLLPLKENKSPAAWLPQLCDKLNAAEEKGAPPLFSCLITVTDHDYGDNLKRHLQSRLPLDSPQGNALLRYYDARVWPHLLRILPPLLLRELFKSVISTWVFRFQDEWISISKPYATGRLLTWQLKEAGQMARLLRSGDISVILQQRQQALGRPWANLDEYQMNAGIADRAMEIAEQQYQLTNERDLNAFALHALTAGEHFHLHPRVQQILGNPGDSDSSYARSSALISDHEWAAITETTRHYS